MLDGRTVWLGAHGWSEQIAEARVIANTDIEAAIEDARARAAADSVMAIYGVQLLPDTATPEPLTMRERIRAFGPSVHPAFAISPQEGQRHE
nr:DUF2849 domain-containing protein [Ameyamaea chiangmaiensis]